MEQSGPGYKCRLETREALGFSEVETEPRVYGTNCCWLTLDSVAGISEMMRQDYL